MTKDSFLKNSFCPLLKGPCYDDCDWMHAFVYFDEDGMERELKCVLNVIADQLLGEGVVDCD